MNRGSFLCEAEYWDSKKCWDDFGPPFFCLSKNAEMDFQNGLSEVCYLGRDDWSIELANFEYLYHNLCIKVPWNMLLIDFVDFFDNQRNRHFMFLNDFTRIVSLGRFYSKKETQGTWKLPPHWWKYFFRLDSKIAFYFSQSEFWFLWDDVIMQERVLLCFFLES